ncbi:AraC family transcriptional regulator [Kistimonas asteriae]|uniref:AraC family transcriptional regulator n=1 Tax=Kistimonas asteriae TaxID=517724 RepID=UPI001BAD8351|nr:AraC family transcriptional regulator [Kistimonas asteriae]
MKNKRTTIAIPTTYVRHLLSLAGQQGIDEPSVLDAAGIRRIELDADDGHIDFDRCDRLVSLILKQTGDASLGWQLGMQLNLPSHGALATAAMSSRSMEESIRVSERYLATRYPLLAVRLFQDGDTAILQFDEVVALGVNRVFYLDAFVASHQVIRRFLYGGSQTVLEIQLACERPRHHAAIDFDGAVLHYGCPANQFRFPAQYLSVPLPTADAITMASAERQCRKMLDSLKLETGLLQQVLTFMRSRENVIPSLEQTADHLGMSPRTLRRQLQEYNTTYRNLVNQERKRLALYFLRNTRLTVEEIAERLDYNDPSNFGRAFRKWTGCSPGHYRESQDEKAV